MDLFQNFFSYFFFVGILHGPFDPPYDLFHLILLLIDTIDDIVLQIIHYILVTAPLKTVFHSAENLLHDQHLIGDRSGSPVIFKHCVLNNCIIILIVVLLFILKRKSIIYILLIVVFFIHHIAVSFAEIFT